MSQPNDRSLCAALGRLRTAIIALCWVIGLSLATQTVIWSLATFTDVRYGESEPPAEAPLIVTAEVRPSASIRPASAADRRNRAASASETPEPTTTTDRDLGAHDRTLRAVAAASRAVGLMAVLVVCPLLALGVVLAASAGAPKVERAVTAVILAIVLVLLAMPLGGWFGLPWHDGALGSYGQMMAEVEAARDEGFSLVFYARFLLLPAASVVGFILVGLQFGSAVEAVLLKRESTGLDPALEREASNVSPSSLHGAGRSAGALKQAMEAAAPSQGSPRERVPTATQLSPGEMPRRLI